MVNIFEALRQVNSKNEYKLFGIHSAPEVEREKDLLRKFGTLGADIIDFERSQVNLYDEEYIRDIPCSSPRVYWFSRKTQKLYTQMFEDEGFLIETKIDGYKRNGQDFEGFRKAQKKISEAGEKVVVWYSPPDHDEEQDAGRLFFSSNSEDGINISLNLKILEEKFPILDFLNHMSRQDATDKLYYLTHPINTGLNLTEFIFYLAGNYFSNKATYVTHRHKDDPELSETFYMERIASQIMDKLGGSDFTNQLKAMRSFQKKFKEKDYREMTEAEISNYIRTESQVRWSYLQYIMEHAKRTNGVIFLYGCSARGIRILGREGILSLFTTRLRSLFVDDPSAADPPIKILERSEDKTSKQVGCVHCKLCGHIVTATIENNMWNCPDCGGSAPYQKH